jgi:hypothetical protein
MSGPYKNDWKSYLSGGTSQFNFNYSHRITTPELTSSPPNNGPAPNFAPSPSAPPSLPHPPSSPPNSPNPIPPHNAISNIPSILNSKKKHINKLHYKIGGRRKTKRTTKKRKHTRRK